MFSLFNLPWVLACRSTAVAAAEPLLGISVCQGLELVHCAAPLGVCQVPPEGIVSHYCTQRCTTVDSTVVASAACTTCHKACAYTIRHAILLRPGALAVLQIQLSMQRQQELLCSAMHASRVQHLSRSSQLPPHLRPGVPSAPSKRIQTGEPTAFRDVCRTAQRRDNTANMP
jgi:hypothetical protein